MSGSHGHVGPGDNGHGSSGSSPYHITTTAPGDRLSAALCPFGGRHSHPGVGRRARHAQPAGGDHLALRFFTED